MKLTKETLKQIIKEELSAVLSEVNMMPDPSRTNLPDEESMGKVMTLLDSGMENSINQARVLIDARAQRRQLSSFLLAHSQPPPSQDDHAEPSTPRPSWTLGYSPHPSNPSH